MILKVSVHDNDFGKMMMRFCNLAATGWFHPKERKPSDDEKDALYKWYSRYMQDSKFFCRTIKMSGSEISEEDKKRVVQIVTDSFAHFVDKEYSDDAKYLQRSFTCEAVESVTDEWANGENYYIFPTSCADSVLCF